eukprot:TRINITY_DN6398_c0_g1_i1.p1 TRINITY_DN6398_c0_g1~~TRINITY_DN6398_c0_g1_i1.p1  ORF type:complete len:187 (-),score=45.62 TRINITY_DN6398_c0_g1_i1:104-664(-)
MKVAILVLLVGIAVATNPADKFSGCFETYGGILNVSSANYTYPASAERIAKPEVLDALIANLTNFDKTCSSFLGRINQFKRSKDHIVGTILYNQIALKLATELRKSLLTTASPNFIRAKTSNLNQVLLNGHASFSRAVYYLYSGFQNEECLKIVQNLGGRSYRASNPADYLNFVYKTVQVCEANSS